MPRVRPFALSLVLALAMLLPVAGATGVHAQDASPEAAVGAWVGQGPDLAAMPLTPGDLDEMGLSGFGRFFNGYFASIDVFAEGTAGFYGQSVEETVDLFDRLGVSRVYGSGMGLPDESGDDESPPARGAYANIIEVENPTEADAFFEYIEGAESETDPRIAAVEAPFDLGDRALIGNFSDFDPDAGERYFEYFVVFRVDNLLVDTGFWTLAPEDEATPEATSEATPAADDPALSSPAGTVAELEMLGQRQLERIETVLAEGAPNLAALLLRLGDDPIAASTDYTEGYRLLNGELPPYYDFEDDILADPAAVTGAEAVYELEELFQVGEEESPQDHYFLNRLYQFPDEDAAAEFIASRPDALETGGFQLATGATDEAGSELLADEATDLGDESLAFSFVRAFDDGERFEGYEVFVRVGAMVAAVSLEGPPDMPLEEVTELAAAQAACLEDGECPDALPVPEAWLASPAATPADATPAA